MSAFPEGMAHREVLIATALAEFTTHGFEGASLNRILADAGMSKGQLYHHFAGKEELYLALVGLVIEKKNETLRDRLPATGGFFHRLRASLRAGLEFLRAHPELDAFSRSVLRERGRPIFARVLATHGFTADAGPAGWVAEAVARGELTDGLPLQLVQRWVALAFNHAPDLVDLDTPGRVEGGLESLVRLLERSLAPDADGGGDDPPAG